MRTFLFRRDGGVREQVGQPQRDCARLHRDEGQLPPSHLPADLQRRQPDQQGRDHAEPLTTCVIVIQFIFISPTITHLLDSRQYQVVQLHGKLSGLSNFGSSPCVGAFAGFPFTF